MGLRMFNFFRETFGFGFIKQLVTTIGCNDPRLVTICERRLV